MAGSNDFYDNVTPGRKKSISFIIWLIFVFIVFSMILARQNGKLEKKSQKMLLEEKFITVTRPPKVSWCEKEQAHFLACDSIFNIYNFFARLA
jgi:hypothetical protein